MISEWRVYSNPIPTDDGIKIKYGVYRSLDTSKTDESGNRQTTMELYDSYEEARQAADLMNSKEGN